MFVKGRSGNPGGRPKAEKLLREAAQKHAAACLETLLHIMQNGESDAARVSATKELLDRGFGKATQPISGDSDGDPVKLAMVVSFRRPDVV